jgi:hypothetical protein
METVELLIARNPDPASRLPYLLRLPLEGGLLYRTSGTWPRTSALFCYPLPLSDWPSDPEVVERIRVRSCARRGAAIDLILDRARENRSQIVYTQARGRDAVFWQSARTRKKARPDVRTPSARAAGLSELEIIVDSHEQYPYRFANKAVTVVRRALPCGDYGVAADGHLVASVERKSLPDLVSSLTGGRLTYAIAELASLPRAAVVVEDRYSQIFKLERVRPSTLADGLAELQLRWPTVPIVFTETRPLAEEWTYRYLAAAHVWAASEPNVLARSGLIDSDLHAGPPSPEPSSAEVRTWARTNGLDVSARGRLGPDIWQAWKAAHGQLQS